MNKSCDSRMDAPRLINDGIKATYTADGKEDSRRRRHHRVKGRGAVNSNLGRVLDLSGGGLRVLGKKKADGQGRVELISAIDSVVFPARVVWCHKVGFRKYVIGLEFIDLTTEQIQQVSQFATAT